MKKGNKEMVREYAQRWRENVTQVKPPLLETNDQFFLNTFKAPFFDHPVSAPTQHFTYIVFVVERIEQAIRAREITNPNENKWFIGRKKEMEVKHLEKASYYNSN